ncbi:MAG: hypothetical protein ACKPKO_36410, partial [Candidatus Fonsibacter sp.]
GATITSLGNLAAGSVSTTTGNITTTSGNISSTSGNIQTINGTITGKHGSFQNLAVTGSTVKPAAPATAGVYIGLDSGNTAGRMEISASSLPYIDFTTPSVDYKGRILYDHSTNELRIFVAGSTTANMTLNSSGLSVGGTFVSASDMILNLNEKPLTNTLDVISQLESVECDQT